MPVPALALAALTAIPSALKIGKGASQAAQARKLAKQQRPTYEIPKSVEESTELARTVFQGGLPGEAVAAERLGAATAAGVGRAKEAGGSSAEILAAVSGLHGAEVEGVRDLAVSAGQAKLTSAQNLMGALRYKGQFEEKAQEYNVLKPYEEAKAAESALRESSFKQLESGVSGLSRIGLGLAGAKGEKGVSAESFLTSMGIGSKGGEAAAKTGAAAEEATADIFTPQKTGRMKKGTELYSQLKQTYPDLPDWEIWSMVTEGAKNF